MGGLNMRYFIALLLIPLCLAGDANQGLLSVIARKNIDADTYYDEANLTEVWISDGFVYNTGTTQATNGQTVSEWVGSLNEISITQATEGDKPLFQTNELNGKPGIEFVSSDWLSKGSALLTSTPMTVYVLAESSDVDILQSLVQFVDSGAADQYFWLALRGDQTGDPISFGIRAGGTSQYANTTTGYSLSVPLLATGYAASATDRKAWIDGGSEGSNTVSTTPVGIDDFSIGMNRDVSPGQPLVGLIYQIRVYNVAHDATARAAVEAEMNTWGGI